MAQRKDTGRPEIAYGRWCKHDQIDHEVFVAELEILLGYPIVRGVQVGNTEPDGMIKLGQNRAYVEVDYSAHMTRKQMLAKWNRYGQLGENEFILVVAMTESRMHRLMKWAEKVKDLIFFTTFARIKSGSTKPWMDFYGNPLRI